MAPIPVTIITGFLGSGKTTVILSLIPQLPPSYKLALLKNEFGDVAIDSRLAGESSVGAVRELLNGCICCNLVGQLGDALNELAGGRLSDGDAADIPPNRIVIETSGSAFPATLAMEVNRLSRAERNSHNEPRYALDGVVVVIDVENWRGYEDTSYTARMQARFTDLVVLNKWEAAGARRIDECRDRLGDIDVPVAVVRSDRGKVDWQVLLGTDGALAARLAQADGEHDHAHGHVNDHADDHQSEVEVLSVTLTSFDSDAALDLEALESLLRAAPKDEVYRIKAILHATRTPISSDDEPEPTPLASTDVVKSQSQEYILNWAFGRWTFTRIREGSADGLNGQAAEAAEKTVLAMTLVTARGEADRWRRKLADGDFVRLENRTDVSKQKPPSFTVSRTA